MAVNYLPDFDVKTLNNYQPGGVTNPAPDEYVGELSVINQQISLDQRPRDQIDYVDDTFTFRSERKYQEKNILVILESPHRFEFDASGNPIALMMGKTGNLFFDYFVKHLAKSSLPLVDGLYNLIVCNAVQYQTSCGLNPINRTIRDQNWLEIYHEKGGEQDFKKRIFAIKPRYTINLCTGGRNPNGLRSQISQSLDAFGLKQGPHYVEGDHPASWYVRREDDYRYIH